MACSGIVNLAIQLNNMIEYLHENKVTTQVLSAAGAEASEKNKPE